MEDYLIHYGVLGMKWGVRRYQNPDGTLTALGKRREKKSAKRQEKELKSLDKYANRGEALRKEQNKFDKRKGAMRFVSSLAGISVAALSIASAPSAGAVLLGLGGGAALSAASNAAGQSYINKQLDKKLSFILNTDKFEK